MDALQPVATVVFVLVLLGAALLLLKKRGAVSFRIPSRGGLPREMQVLERVALGPQHALHLVRVGGRSLIVSTAPSSCQLICEGLTREGENQ